MCMHLRAQVLLERQVSACLALPVAVTSCRLGLTACGVCPTLFRLQRTIAVQLQSSCMFVAALPNPHQSGLEERTQLHLASDRDLRTLRSLPPAHGVTVAPGGDDTKGTEAYLLWASSRGSAGSRSGAAATARSG